MDPQLRNALNDSVHLTQNLLAMLEQDVGHMRGCVTGEILEEYRKVTDLAKAKTTKLKNRLMQLQAEEEQRLRM